MSQTKVYQRKRKKRPSPYASMIQDDTTVLSEGKSSSSESEGRRSPQEQAEIMSETKGKSPPYASMTQEGVSDDSRSQAIMAETKVYHRKGKERPPPHASMIQDSTAMLSEEKKEMPHPYAFMIQEAMLSEGGSSSESDKGRSQRFISDYILTKYPSTRHGGDDHTRTLIRELHKLTQRKVLTCITNVEDQSDNRYILQEIVDNENTRAEGLTTAPHDLLHPDNCPRVVEQHPQRARRDQGDHNNDIAKRQRRIVQEVEQRTEEMAVGVTARVVESSALAEGEVEAAFVAAAAKAVAGTILEEANAAVTNAEAAAEAARADANAALAKVKAFIGAAAEETTDAVLAGVKAFIETAAGATTDATLAEVKAVVEEAKTLLEADAAKEAAADATAAQAAAAIREAEAAEEAAQAAAAVAADAKAAAASLRAAANKKK